MRLLKTILRKIGRYLPSYIRKFFLVEINGLDNRIIVIKDGKEYINKINMIPDGFTIEIKGSKNTVKFYSPIHGNNNVIEINTNETLVEIGASPWLNSLRILCSGGFEQIIKIGKNTTIEGSLFIRTTYNAKVFIGTDCAFAHDIFIRATDAHSIIDKETGGIINKPKHPIVIGNHCWIGQRCLIGKNAMIPANTIVGMGSIVTKIFTKENTIIAGNPAKIIKENIDWDRRDIMNMER
jgi:acetyltransferase-like isoleucine patch superfamily enzyme